MLYTFLAWICSILCLLFVRSLSYTLNISNLELLKTSSRLYSTLYIHCSKPKCLNGNLKHSDALLRTVQLSCHCSGVKGRTFSTVFCTFSLPGKLYFPFCSIFILYFVTTKKEYLQVWIMEGQIVTWSQLIAGQTQMCKSHSSQSVSQIIFGFASESEILSTDNRSNVQVSQSECHLDLILNLRWQWCLLIPVKSQIYRQVSKSQRGVILQHSGLIKSGLDL